MAKEFVILNKKQNKKTRSVPQGTAMFLGDESMTGDLTLQAFFVILCDIRLEKFCDTEAIVLYPVLFFFFSPQASVHLPRIGYATKGFNWYGTERLIRKHLASRRIPTYMYPSVHIRKTKCEGKIYESCDCTRLSVIMQTC